MVCKGTRISRFAFRRPQMISSTVLLNVRKPVGSEEEIDFYCSLDYSDVNFTSKMERLIKEFNIKLE